jgi:acyl-CoA synthetase (AMP-forming)/AMP-acid ligase II
VAGELRSKGVVPGDRVMVAYPPGLDFMVGFFGCMRLGAIACSVYPPNPHKKAAHHSFAQFNQQTHDAGATVGLTSSTFRRLLRLAALQGHKTTLKWITTDDVVLSSTTGRSTADRDGMVPLFVPPKVDDIAFIQYSSGSTSEPKGVMITHRALMHNLAMIENRQQLQCHQAVGLSWMPQYHDFALVGGFMQSVWTTTLDYIAMSPIDFIKNPLIWADAIAKFRPTHTGGPNFAFGLLAKRLKAARRVLPPDCSIVCAMMGGEPISCDTIREMQDVGFPAAAIKPSYGMAETCLFAISAIGDDLLFDSAGRTVSQGSVEQARQFGVYFLICDRHNNDVVLESGSEGEVMLASPSLASGYWAKPELSKAFQAKVFENRAYFATGDLGKIENGRLFITGRLKELIIVNGKNVIPTDLERTIEKRFESTIRPGSTVAYQHGPTSVGIVLEIRDSALSGKWHDHVNVDSIRGLLREAHDVDVGFFFALKQGTVPKTTSGKLRRVETRQRSLDGEWQHQSILTKSVSVGCRSKSDSELVMASFKDVEAGNALPSNASMESVLMLVLGGSFDGNKSWEELGMTSLLMVEIQNQVIDRFQVTLPPLFTDLYPTPNALCAFVRDNAHRDELPIELEALPQYPKNMSRQALAVLQLVGTFFNLLLLASSFVPVYQVGKILVSIDALNQRVGNVTWQWLPILIPVWMISLSTVVLFSKWTLIGQYKPAEAAICSRFYARWWIVDRLVHLWEIWVGNLILDTVFIWAFYRMMGARIHPSAEIKAFIREFDLVEIGARTQLHHRLVCRRFGTEGKGNFTIRFRSIRIGSECKVQGILGPGVMLGDRVQTLRLSAVAEGCQVPDDVSLKGSPAQLHQQAPPPEQAPAPERMKRNSVVEIVAFESLKVVWLVLELYMSMSFLLCGNWLLLGRLPSGFRYTPLLHWFLLVLINTGLGVLTCIILKWTLIGKKKPGFHESSVLSRWAEWCVDYHFYLSLIILDSFAENSRLMNLYKQALGMDIDLSSHAWAAFCPPSKVDLVSVKRSFLSAITFDVEQDGEYRTIEIVDSSCGYDVVLLGGTKVSGAQIAPFSLLDRPVKGNLPPLDSIMNRDLGSLALLAIGFISLIPAYELFGVEFPNIVGFSILKIAGVFAVQTLVWLALFACLQHLVIARNSGDGQWKATSYSLYSIYMTTSYYWIHKWSLFHLVWGSPLQNLYYSVLGAKLTGHCIFFSVSMYDFPALSVDNAVVDHGIISGHSVAAGKLEIGPATITGVFHERSVVLAHTDLTGNTETGPYRFVPPSSYTVISNNTLTKKRDGADTVDVDITPEYNNLCCDEGKTAI